MSLREISLSARRLLAFVFMLFLFILAAKPINDPDFWWHLKTGQYMLQTRSVPHSDIFAFVHFGKEWVTHEWLSEIFISSIYGLFSSGGLIVVFSLIVTAAFWITWRRCAQYAGHPYVAGFAVILGALASAPTWGVRPQMFSILFASIFIAILNNCARQANSRHAFWLIPLTLLWVNMHAGFALGLALILLTMVGIALDGIFDSDSRWESIRRTVYRLGVVWLLCIVAVLFNPNGARMYLYPFETLTSPAMMKHIEEWLSPDFHELMFQPLAILFFVTFIALVLSRQRVRLSSLLILVATGYAALRSGRNVPFFALVAAPLLAEHSWAWITTQRWSRWVAMPEQREIGRNAQVKVVLNVALMIVAPLAVAFVRVEHTIAAQSMTEAREFPRAAVEFIRAQHLPQPIYNEYGWGGYLIWKLYPEYRVYVDGRADVYGDAFIEEFLNTHDGRMRWREPLDRHGIRTVLIKPDAPLASLLRQEVAWKKVFEDSQSVVFTRNN